MLRDEVFRGLKPESLSISVGSVEKVYRRTYRADVYIAQSNQYLRKVMIASSYVGRGFGLITPLTEGDIVLIAFVGGSVDVPIIIGRLFTEGKEGIEPPDTEEDEVIFHHKTGTKIQIMGDGEIVFTGVSGTTLQILADGEVIVTPISGKQILLGSSSSKEQVVLGNVFMTLFNLHTHPTGVGPSGPPTQQMSGTQLSTISKTEA